MAGERSRMADLQRMLPAGSGDDKERTRRAGLSDRIRERMTVVTNLGRAADGWDRWHAELDGADQLVDELVALFLTRLLRQHGVGAGTFAAAETLLGELEDRAEIGRVVLGQTQELEMADHTRSSIALRFPGSGVWELPFLVHEFGHHAVERLSPRSHARAGERPLAETVTAVAEVLTGRGTPDEKTRSHAEELVADGFATVCCGATYPVACLCLRTPHPARASISDSTHPSWNDRVATMRAVLDALTERTGLTRYRWMREELVDPLARRTLGMVPTVGDAAAEAGERTVRSLGDHRPDLVYRDEVQQAIGVAAALERGDPTPPAGANVRSVLDGAWRVRLGGEAAVHEDAIADLALRYCVLTTTGEER